VRRWHSIRRVNHFTGHRHELLKARTRDDDRVATTMSFLGDTHEAASFIFSKFNVEMLTLNLEFFRDDYVVHGDLEGMPLKQSIYFRPGTAGRTVLNDTKGVYGKLLNSRPQPLICNPSFSCDERKIEALLQQIDSFYPNNDLVAYPETHPGSAPGDALAYRVKNEKVQIDGGDAD
jgi:hypothetical protein